MVNLSPTISHLVAGLAGIGALAGLAATGTIAGSDALTGITGIVGVLLGTSASAMGGTAATNALMTTPPVTATPAPVTTPTVKVN